MNISNKAWGEYGERVVRSRYRLREISDVREWFADAEVTERSTLPEPGTLVEVKSCRRLISNGCGPKPGRWWLARDATEELANEDGLLALVVYDPDRDNSVLRTELLPATDVLSEYIEEWTSNGRNHHKSEESVRLHWPEVLGTLRDPLPPWEFHSPSR